MSPGAPVAQAPIMTPATPAAVGPAAKAPTAAVATAPQARLATPTVEGAPPRAAAPAGASPQPERAAAAPARTGSPAVPAVLAAPLSGNAPANPRLANQAPIAGNQLPLQRPEAQQAPVVTSPERRPAAAPGERHSLPAAVNAPAAEPAAPSVATHSKGQPEQARPAGAPVRPSMRTAAQPAIPVASQEQPVAEKLVASDARSAAPSPTASDREPAASAPSPSLVRGDRRPVRATRPEPHGPGSDDRRSTEAPIEVAPQRPLPQRAAMAALNAQQELAEVQPEIRRSAESKGLPTPDISAARPKLVRPRDRSLGEDDVAADDRKPVRAIEKDHPNLVLMQLAAPPAAPPVELVNARLQVMAREGRAGLESAAINAAGNAGSLLDSAGTDASRTRNEHELPWQGPSLALPQDATLPGSLNAAATPVAEGPAAPSLPPAATPLLDQAALDPGLNVAVMSRAAHMTITNDDGRALELHLRLSPEGADIRASGNLAPMVQARVAELGMALASQGLTLGSFEMGRDGSGHPSRDSEEERDSAHGEDAPSGRRAVRANSPTGTGSVTNVAGRIHVKV
jgi:hypothetical protein